MTKRTLAGTARRRTGACSMFSPNIQVQGRDINHVIRDFNNSILKAAHKAIPRGLQTLLEQPTAAATGSLRRLNLEKKQNVTHLLRLWHQRGTRKDGHILLADCTFSVAAIEKKEECWHDNYCTLLSYISFFTVQVLFKCYSLA